MTLTVSRTFMAGLDKQSSQASGLTSRFQKSMNVHRGTGVSTNVTLHQSLFLYSTCYTSVNRIILQN